MHTIEPFSFRVILLSTFVLFVSHRAYYNLVTGREQKVVLLEKEDGWAEKLAGALVLLGLISAAFYIAKPIWMEWAAIGLSTNLRWFGTGLAAAGFALLQWSHISLGRNWSDQPRITAGQELVRNGPYRYIRHPIYTSFLMIFSSMVLISANWFVGLTWIAGTAIDITRRVEFEEAVLEETFGSRYRQYKEETGALIPRV